MSSCASRAATMPAIRSSSTASAYKLSLLPSGVVRPGKLSIIGNGVVVDPQALLAEIDGAQRPGRRGVAGDAADRRERVADPAASPRARPGARDCDIVGTRIGTTGRGIGPAYEDKVGRRAIRVMDLADPDTLPRKSTGLLAHHNALRRGLGVDEVDRRPLLDELLGARAARPALCRSRLAAPRRAPARRRAHPVRGRAGHPRSTSTTAPIRSSPRPTPVAGQAATGSGLGPGAIDYVLGITKAYTTRVGEGPFPTEDHDEVGDFLGRARPRIRHGHRPQAPLRLVRCGAGAPGGRDYRASTASR